MSSRPRSALFAALLLCLWIVPLTAAESTISTALPAWGTEPTPNGVRIVYRLIPLRPIDKLEFEGNLGLSEGDLRSAVRESLGTSLAINRIETAKGVLRQRYFDKGYDAAQVDHQLVPRTNPDRSTLSICITNCGIRQSMCRKTGCWDSGAQKYCGLLKQ